MLSVAHKTAISKRLHCLLGFFHPSWLNETYSKYMATLDLLIFPHNECEENPFLWMFNWAHFFPNRNPFVSALWKYNPKLFFKKNSIEPDVKLLSSQFNKINTKRSNWATTLSCTNGSTNYTFGKLLAT